MSTLPVIATLGASTSVLRLKADPVECKFDTGTDGTLYSQENPTTLRETVSLPFKIELEICHPCVVEVPSWSDRFCNIFLGPVRWAWDTVFFARALYVVAIFDFTEDPSGGRHRIFGAFHNPSTALSVLNVALGQLYDGRRIHYAGIHPMDKGETVFMATRPGDEEGSDVMGVVIRLQARYL